MQMCQENSFSVFEKSAFKKKSYSNSATQDAIILILFNKLIIFLEDQSLCCSLPAT